MCNCLSIPDDNDPQSRSRFYSAKWKIFSYFDSALLRKWCLFHAPWITSFLCSIVYPYAVPISRALNSEHWTHANRNEWRIFASLMPDGFSIDSIDKRRLSPNGHWDAATIGIRIHIGHCMRCRAESNGMSDGGRWSFSDCKLISEFEDATDALHLGDAAARWNITRSSQEDEKNATFNTFLTVTAAAPLHPCMTNHNRLVMLAKLHVALTNRRFRKDFIIFASRFDVNGTTNDGQKNCNCASYALYGCCCC